METEELEPPGRMDQTRNRVWKATTSSMIAGQACASKLGQHSKGNLVSRHEGARGPKLKTGERCEYEGWLLSVRDV